MNKNKATEAIVENAAKAIIEDLGEELAGALVEYHDLVKQLAEDLRKAISFNIVLYPYKVMRKIKIIGF